MGCGIPKPTTQVSSTKSFLRIFSSMGLGTMNSPFDVLKVSFTLPVTFKKPSLSILPLSPV